MSSQLFLILLTKCYCQHCAVIAEYIVILGTGLASCSAWVGSKPTQGQLDLVRVVLSDELSFRFYFSIFVALMVGTGKLRVVSWIIKQRMNKKNIWGWFYLFCYLKNILSMGRFFRGLSLSAKEWIIVSSALTCISGFPKCVLPHFIVVWGRKNVLNFMFDHLCVFLT